MRHPDAPHPRPAGISAHALGNDTLLHELEQLHRTRHETFLYGSEEALNRHTLRTGELEAEFLRRFPNRQVTAARTRAGARAREAAARVESLPE
ncbi:DUF6158 family protein [Kitasatospora sp. NPDC088351]|uniref:DUF6158 family protein n=1 Tax=unclassified Kitasatospora TaxID=2633591 RepID=UPI00342686A8